MVTFAHIFLVPQKIVQSIHMYSVSSKDITQVIKIDFLETSNFFIIPSYTMTTLIINEENECRQQKTYYIYIESFACHISLMPLFLLCSRHFTRCSGGIAKIKKSHSASDEIFKLVVKTNKFLSIHSKTCSWFCTMIPTLDFVTRWEELGRLQNSCTG